jgi:hypothetical protein
VPRSDGKGVDHHRHAEARFASAADLPASFGAPDDPAPLHARTSLTMTPLDGGRVRYTFERRYAPRDWAWRARLERLAFPDELKQALSAPREGPLADDLLRRALEALLSLARDEARAHLDRALDAVAPGADAATHLRARAALDRRFAAAWKADELLPAARHPEQLGPLEARFREQVAADAAAAAREALGGDPALEARARAAFEAARRDLDVTQDLRDERFVVRVTLPVPVVAHDGEALEDGGRTVVFRFQGEDLCDREQVLRVTGEGRP